MVVRTLAHGSLDPSNKSWDILRKTHTLNDVVDLGPWRFLPATPQIKSDTPNAYEKTTFPLQNHFTHFPNLHDSRGFLKNLGRYQKFETTIENFKNCMFFIENFKISGTKSHLVYRKFQNLR